MCFAITDFALEVHVLEKAGRKHLSFKHVSMTLDIFILVFFQVFAAFNRPHLPPDPDIKRKNEYIEVGRVLLP